MFDWESRKTIFRSFYGHAVYYFQSSPCLKNLLHTTNEIGVR